MKPKNSEQEARLTGRKARRIDIEAWIRRQRHKSREFRESFDAARQATEIARELARIRKLEGVSQAEIAKRLKTSQQAISRIEHPEYEGHTVRTLVRYAESLGRELRFVLSEPAAHYGPKKTPRE
jgi:DNA-binding XRE family transcriptional regulator